jgi:hypothetical protein
MKANYVFLFALIASLAASKSLKSGNVLTSFESADGWGKWVNDLIFIIFGNIAMVWCFVMGFFSGLTGDNLIGFQKCWAGMFSFFFGGDW